ncbi:hypothetical protein CRP01_40110 [Flavilitoribacter nigricans DSM 23189 = NBRC 102662]|uniref:Uncharacterized protein n=1 Tax=Flavilitoribacter nigricans (strain ATCC 23147 / DSM 23189 / NBRC 102662 / NCIMB 1420 / SS-2) TaxID=1122177 RepID=A0A2D0MX34_FLAN2|nr:hypothetical protein CRP01_40110 [Flavilitoribacter nigricans DSM 23189 = NBRC 102662]
MIHLTFRAEGPPVGLKSAFPNKNPIFGQLRVGPLISGLLIESKHAPLSHIEIIFNTCNYRWRTASRRVM